MEYLLCILSPRRDGTAGGQGSSAVPPKTLDHLVFVTLLNRGNDLGICSTVDK